MRYSLKDLLWATCGGVHIGNGLRGAIAGEPFVPYVALVAIGVVTIMLAAGGRLGAE